MGLLGNIFGDIGNFFGGGSGSPYEKAGEQYQKYGQAAQQFQQPFYQAGTAAIPQYQAYLAQMQDPSKFLNNMMGQYQQSPYNQYLQRQNLASGQAAASAAGLSGSTPMMQQLQSNANNIAMSGQNSWLQNALGINSQYGQGLQGMMNMGQGAANQLSSENMDLAQLMGQSAYGQQAGKQQDWSNLFSDVGNIFGSGDMSSLWGGGGSGMGGGTAL